MNHRLDTLACKHARNSRAYAIGEQQRNGFHVRKVVWGRLMAKYERRPGERIKRAIIWVEREKKSPGRVSRGSALDQSNS